MPSTKARRTRRTVTVPLRAQDGTKANRLLEADSGGGGGAHAADHENGGSDEINVGGLSGVLADPQTPAAHAASHQNSGGDEINVAGLSGVLADPQTPAAHAASHQNSGGDEISVAGLSGLLADAQTPLAHNQAISTITGLQTALDEKVVGPASATDDAVAVYDGTTGKLVQDSGVKIISGDIVLADAKVVRAGTSDGSDNASVAFAGGGAPLITRGGIIFACGNESASPGQIRMFPGNVSGSSVTMARADGNTAVTVDGATGLVTFHYGQLAFPAAQNASSNANTLDDYEEGTWTPADNSGAGLSFVSPAGAYCKIGQMVFAQFELTYPATADGSQARISLPINEGASVANGWSAVPGYQSVGFQVTMIADGGSAFLYKNETSSVTNAEMSGKVMRGVAVYRAGS